jgi:membrane fusion protein (multidrug efflux system)
MIRKFLLAGIGFVVVVAALVWGWQWWTVDRFFQSTDDAYVQSDVSVVSPKIQGYIRELRVTDNQQVKAGDVLAVIEDNDFSAKLQQSQAAVDAQAAMLGTIDAQIALQGSQIAQAQAGVASSEADLKRTELDYLRYKNLSSSEWASRQRYEQADADYRKAVAALAKSRADLATQRDQLGVLQAQRHQTEANLAEAKASLQLAQIDLDNTLIRAPVDGVVGNRGVQVGQLVKAGTQLLSIVPLPFVYVLANFKETQLARMRPGQEVRLSVDAYPNAKLVGRVESFSPGSGAQFSLLPPENATGNFTKIVQRVPVRIAVSADNKLAGWLRPGLSVTASVDTRGEGTLAGPGTAFGAVLPPEAVSRAQ